MPQSVNPHCRATGGDEPWFECDRLASYPTYGQQGCVHKAAFGEHCYHGFVLFGADRTSEHFKGCVALANIPIDDHRLLISMNPDSTILYHPLAISRFPQPLLNSFLNLR